MNHSEHTDAELWAKFKDGDDEALTLIYTSNSRKLYLYGLKFTRNKTIIEDSIQDLFADLVRTRKTLGEANNIRVYLLVSFKRKLFHQLEKEKRYNLEQNDEGFVFDITYSVEHDIIRQESSDIKLRSLNEALEQLTPRQKEAVYLRFTEELEYIEVARIMEMSVEACRNIVCKAIKSLKDSIKERATILFFYFKNLP